MPGLIVATEAFTEAVFASNDALGSQVEAVYVPHPVSSRSNEELAELARTVFPLIIDHLTCTPDPKPQTPT